MSEDSLQQTARALVRGAFDMHVHSSPDVLPRKLTDVELAQQATEMGIAGMVLKSHFAPTAGRASLIREMFPGFQAFGGMALNHPVGGLNPVAVDIAGRLGTKVIWLPTVDAANEVENIAGNLDESQVPFWMGVVREMHARGIVGQPIRVTDEDGKVTPAARQCIEVIAHYNMVLATGHVSYPEMLAVAKVANEVGVERLVITHPEFPTLALSVDQQMELARHGAYFERCFVTGYSGKVAWEVMHENIRKVGSSTTILSSDLGQVSTPWVGDGLVAFIANLLEAGFREAEIETMSQVNAAQVLDATRPS